VLALFEPPQPAATTASAATAAHRASFHRTGASVTAAICAGGGR
jgi:hypothetical protein